jgi:hypothetical protein
MNPTCACGCNRPVPDGYAAPACMDRARQQLAEIADLTVAARDVAQRQARRGVGGGASGKPGSSLPIDLGATARLDAVQNCLTGWVRVIAEERGPAAEINAGASGGVSGWGGMGETGRDDLRASAQWLGGHCEWMRHRPEVDEFLRDVEACARVIRRVADPSRDRRVVVGLCDCGRMLYAPKDREIVTCPDCERHWDVDASTENMRGHLDERLVTAAEAAHLAGFLDTDRSGKEIRKLVNKWAERGELSVDLTGDEPRHWFGNIAARLAVTPRRAVQEPAEMGA